MTILSFPVESREKKGRVLWDIFGRIRPRRLRWHGAVSEWISSHDCTSIVPGKGHWETGIERDWDATHTHTHTHTHNTRTTIRCLYRLEGNHSKSHRAPFNPISANNNLILPTLHDESTRVCIYIHCAFGTVVSTLMCVDHPRVKKLTSGNFLDQIKWISF